MTNREIEETVRTKFFPGWDRARQWRFRFKKRWTSAPGELELCDFEKKIINLVSLRDTDMLLYTTIHEVCHVVARSNHTKTFVNRLEIVRDKALHLKFKKVAGLITKKIMKLKQLHHVASMKDKRILESLKNGSFDAEGLKELLRLSLRDAIEAAVHDNPKADFDSILRTVAPNHTPEYVKACFENSKGIYLKAKELGPAGLERMWRERMRQIKG